MSLKSEAVCLLNTYPEELQYFKEEHINQCICIPEDKPNIDEIVDVFIHPEIIDMRILKSKDGISNEGQKLTGYKLVVQVKLNEKITYISDDGIQSVCALHYEILKSIFIILPEEVEGKSISDMFKSSRIIVNPFIEHTDTRMLDCRNINTSILIILDARIC